MPYYVFHITGDPTGLVKNLDFQQSFESYKEARNFARGQRAELGRDTEIIVKVVFAASRLAAEELLMEKREKPILMEWEK
ncbi:hypothetical protein QVG61_03155 [Thiohalobacter sp. IOR34]|uniref:hypothetical protein n=1 Tax=Thiohalobacter sp. IOR34 TaxID=3057176 RepID=UPI0025AFAE5B|nr:hypothetical protein [Thiohalobacter sp. IOR34]WJW76105.1 hypothetical protein QVG61_03155 [Thiohalobacter sp. IOR34]